MTLALPSYVTAQPSNLSETEIETERDVTTVAGDSDGSIDEYLRESGENLNAIESLVQVKVIEGTDGRTHYVHEQNVDGKRVIGSLVKSAFDADGRLISISRRLSETTTTRITESVSAEIALQAAIAATHGSEAPVPDKKRTDDQVTRFFKGAYYHTDPTAEAVYLSMGNVLEAGWLVTTWSDDDNMLYETQVNGQGDVVDVELRTSNDNYNVYADHPGVSPQAIVQGPGASNAQSPNGWLWDGSAAGEPDVTQYARIIQGNNVRAYIDRDANNSPDTDTNVITDDNFVTVSNLSQAPTTTQNQEVAVQNLFFWNNVIHDELYRHGFTESAGNFQEDNFGRGGRDGDSVDAEAQDGRGNNNANFATPSDGGNGRMQMYLWSRTNPWRDGDLDSDIIWHEYGHGLTWRMIGSMSGSVSGAIGEGMSDVLAIIMNDNPVVGEYSTNNTNRGIRSAPYDAHPDTLSSFRINRGVHRNGELYAATIWTMRERYYDAGYTRDDLMTDIIQGMNFTAPRPDFLDMRNGILDAAPDNRDCLVWAAFAEKGMGDGALFSDSSQTESYDLPAGCTAPPPSNLPHVAAMTTTQRTRDDFWAASVTIETDTPFVVVVGEWTNDNKSRECTTDANGLCSIESRFRRLSQENTFTLYSVDDETPTFAAGLDGTVTVLRADDQTDPPAEGITVQSMVGSQQPRDDFWSASVTIQTDTPSARVLGEWATDNESRECVTNTSGACTITSRFRRLSQENTFTLYSIDDETPNYAAGTSNTLTVFRESGAL